MKNKKVKMIRYFKFTKKTLKSQDGRVLHLIEAIRDFTCGDDYWVYKGEKGGYVESEKNLSPYTPSWVDAGSQVYGDASVCRSYVKDSKIYENANVTNSTIKNSSVYGKANISGSRVEHSSVSGEANVFGSKILTSNVSGNSNITMSLLDYSRMQGCNLYNTAVRNNGKEC